MKKLLFAFALVAQSSFAAPIHYTLTGEFFTNSPDPAVIGLGDPFEIQFDWDGSAIVAGGSGTAYAPNVISNLAFNLQPGAAGSYTGGSLTQSQGIALYDNVAIGSGQDWIYIHATSGLNFPSISGHAVNELRMGFQSNSSSVFDLSSASGMTVDALLGPDPLSLNTYDYVAMMYLAMDNNQSFAMGFITATEVASSSVPDNGLTAALLGLPFLGLAVIRRRR